MLLSPEFWNKPLFALNEQEWDALCDGCGKCCLVKLQDEDSDDVLYTSVACRYLNAQCRCLVYAQRQRKKADCLVLTRENIAQVNWLPESCAYRLRYENKPLPEWHPLLAGNAQVMHNDGHSVKGRFYSEEHIHEDDLPQFIVRWVH